MDILQQKGQRFSVNGSTPSSGSVTITEAASLGKTHYVTEIGGSSADATAVITLTAGATTYWSERISNTTPYEKVFRVPIRITTGSAVVVKVVDAAGGVTHVNLAGYTI